MPLFDFKCPACGLEFPDLLLASHEEPGPCPYCGEALKKKPAAASFRVKGFNAKNGYSSGGGKEK